MKSLLIENSTGQGTLAVTSEGDVLVRRTFAKAGELAVAIQAIFLELGAPDEIIVGLGPGSYTGLRVASATAIGMQLALGCPAYGCPSVLGYQNPSYHVVGDARLTHQGRVGREAADAGVARRFEHRRQRRAVGEDLDAVERAVVRHAWVLA